MRPRKKDPSFLYIAALAGTGGMLAIVLSIGFPIWLRMRGQDVTPAFSLFAGWGVAAMMGAYACVRTYMISDDPGKPPRGGVRLVVIKNANAVPSRSEAETSQTERAA